VSFALIAFLKGKTKLGASGICVPGSAVIAALRLAKRTSLWARRFHSETGGQFIRKAHTKRPNP
jgi:hypothetical protein